MNGLNKNIYRSVIIVSFIAVNALILFGISSVLAFLNSGADRSSMLNIEFESKDVYFPEVNWENFENPGREIESPTIKKIQKDYLSAWYIRNVAYQTNNTYGIEDFYTDSSRINLYEIIEFNKRNNISIEATTLNHQPNLKFYSADGQLVVFTDEQVIEYQKIFQNKEFIYAIRDTSEYQVMMLLEDGFWRIRHMVKSKAKNQAVIENQEAFVHSKKQTLIVAGKSFLIKGINYYPQKNPWDMFGEQFNPELIQDDFQKIKKAQLNSVRIFVPYEDFGKAEVNSEKLKKLETVLNLAQNSELKVVITLFDFYGDYSVLDWSLTSRHAEQLVKKFKNHVALLAWDIKNEPDLDFESRGKDNVLGWLSEMAGVIRKFDPNHLLTVGWSSPKTAAYLSESLDIISFHYYLGVDEFESHFRELKGEINDKPLLVQEFGMSSYKGIWNPFGYNEKQQAEYHKKMQVAFEKNELAFMSWTLYDFDNIPVSVVGSLPWRKSKQKEFGFLDRLGKPKLAFEFISH